MRRFPLEHVRVEQSLSPHAGKGRSTCLRLLFGLLVPVWQPMVAAWLVAGMFAASAPIPLRAAPEHDQGAVCGRPHTVQETVFLHRQGLLQNPDTARAAALDRSGITHVGEIALVEASPEIVLRPNPVDLTGRKVTITPDPTGFTIAGSARPASPALSEVGLPINLGDDDFAVIELPFPFPYYGAEYTRGFVHSDGTLTFVSPDAGSTARSFSRAVVGPPRIAPLFLDLDPSQGGRIRMAVRDDRVLLTWHAVPVWMDTGLGTAQTFQLVLASDGTIEFHYGQLDTAKGVVGLFPGNAAGDSVPVDWSAAESMTVQDDPVLAEVFSAETGLDEVALARAFFRDHEDAYDALVLFTDLDFDTTPDALAWAAVVRNDIKGIGVPLIDRGATFGSPRRLSAFVNMGPLSDYPRSPLAPVPSVPHQSLLTTLAHELGHRFLAYAPWRDPETGKQSSALLGRQLSHWSFFFNSGASMLEGNSIRDHGTAASPRFETVAVGQAFGQLDQYLMGLVGPGEIRATFLVENPSGAEVSANPERAPEVGVSFDGIRKEVRIEDIIAAAGPRRPDASVSQRHFRYAFLLLVEDAEAPDPDSIRKLNRLRTYWRMLANVQFGDKASTATELVKMLHLTTWPAGGVLSGGTGTARVMISAPRDTDLVVSLTVQDPVATVPATVVIPAGQAFAEFGITGAEAGTTTLTARAADTGYDTAVTRINVREGLAGLHLEALHAGELLGIAGTTVANRIDYRVIDENRVPYSGIALEFAASDAGGEAIPDATTDFEGQVGIEWQLTEGTGVQVLTASIKGQPEIHAVTKASVASQTPTLAAAATVNAASGAGAAAGGGFAPGSLVTIFGTGLATSSVEAPTLDAVENPSLPYELDATRVHVEGVAVPLVRVAPDQITLQLPFEIAGDSAQVIVATAYGRSDPAEIPLSDTQPGIFADRVSGSAGPGTDPEGGLPAAGGALYAYGTGLGAVSPAGRTGMAGLVAPPQLLVGATTARVGGQEVDVMSSKLASFEAGVYEVVIGLPDDLEAGTHTLQIAVDDVVSNEVEFVSE